VSSLALRPRSATEIIDASFQLLRQYYFQLVALAVVALLPYMVLQFVVSTTGSTPTAASIVIVVQLLCTVVAEGTMIVAVSDSYLTGRMDIGSALSRTVPRLLAIVGAAIVRALLVAIVTIPVGITMALLIPSFTPAGGGGGTLAVVGLVLVAALIAPAVYVGVRTFATTAVLLLEHTSIQNAITRTWRLARGEVARICFALFLAWLLYFVLFFVFTTILAMLVGRNSDVLAILTAVILAFAYPLIGVVTTLLYYDLRVRHEGLDLEMMAGELGG
jgi:hypothetical protein